MDPVQRRAGTAAVDADVLVVGAGATGLTLAAELALAGTHVIVIERREDQALLGTRAGGLQARTLEMFEQRGIADRFLSQGEALQINMFGSIKLDIGDFPSRHPYGLALQQGPIEAILAGWADELAVEVRRGCDVTGVSQDDEGVGVRLGDGATLRARYVVGCDGGRSVVRKAAGIVFAGWDATTSYLLAEAEMPDDPVLGFAFDEAGRHAIRPLGDGEDRVGFVVQEVPPRAGDRPTLEEVRAAVIAVWGRDFGLRSPTWISRFSDAARQAVAYRERRVLLAGDAAHVHSPVGGQGLNLGVQDAMNLGWKLGQVIRGSSPPDLLDTYHAERHPVAAAVLQGTMAQTAILAGDDRSAALRDTLAEVLALDAPRKLLAGRLSGLSIHYDLGSGHPLLGRRMPDLELSTREGSVQLSSLLHGGRPVLLALQGESLAGPAPWGAGVRCVQASYAGPWELPVLGEVEPPPAVLIRPDGHVAWTGSLSDPDLRPALARWCGEPAPAPAD